MTCNTPGVFIVWLATEMKRKVTNGHMEEKQVGNMEEKQVGNMEEEHVWNMEEKQVGNMEENK